MERTGGEDVSCPIEEVDRILDAAGVTGLSDSEIVSLLHANRISIHHLEKIVSHPQRAVAVRYNIRLFIQCYIITRLCIAW